MAYEERLRRFWIAGLTEQAIRKDPTQTSMDRIEHGAINQKAMMKYRAAFERYERRLDAQIDAELAASEVTV